MRPVEALLSTSVDDMDVIGVVDVVKVLSRVIVPAVRRRNCSALNAITGRGSRAAAQTPRFMSGPRPLGGRPGAADFGTAPVAV